MTGGGIGEPIRTIDPPSVAAFHRDHVSADLPVVIRDLYAHSPLGSVTTARDAVEAFGQTRLLINENSYDTRGIAAPEQFTCTLSDYLDLARQDRALRLLVTEQHLAPEISALMSVPAIAESESAQPPEGFMFAAARGLFAPLHFDGDFRDVLLTQVFGRKRVVLVPPRFSRRLLPVGNLSALAIHLLPEPEKRALLELNAPTSCVLSPGETLYIPRLWWHYVENLETSMSVSFRFGRSGAAYRLSTLPASHALQNLASVVLDRATGEVRDAALFARIFEVYFARHPSPRARFDAFHAELDAMYRERCPDALQGIYEAGAFARRDGELADATRHSWFRPAATLAGPALAELDRRALGRLRRWWHAVPLHEEHRAAIAGRLEVEPDLGRASALDAVLLRDAVARVGGARA